MCTDDSLKTDLSDVTDEKLESTGDQATTKEDVAQLKRQIHALKMQVCFFFIFVSLINIDQWIIYKILIQTIQLTSIFVKKFFWLQFLG